MTSTGSTGTLTPVNVSFTSRLRLIDEHYAFYVSNGYPFESNRSHDYTIQIPSSVKQFKRLQLITAEMPIGGYNISDGSVDTNNLLQITDVHNNTNTLRNYGIYVKAKKYKLNELIDFIQNEINKLTEPEDIEFRVEYTMNQVFDSNTEYNLVTFSILADRQFKITPRGLNDSHGRMTINNLIGLDAHNQTVASLVPGSGGYYKITGNEFIYSDTDGIEIKMAKNNELFILTENNAQEETIRYVAMERGNYDEVSFSESLSQLINDEVDTSTGLPAGNANVSIQYNSTTMKYDLSWNIPGTNVFGIINIFDTLPNNNVYTRYNLVGQTVHDKLGINIKSPPVDAVFEMPIQDKVYTPMNVAQLSRDEYIYIGLNIIKGQVNALVPDNSILADKGIIAKIQLTMSSGEYVYYDDNTNPIFDIYNMLSGIDNIIEENLRFTLYRSDGSMYFLNGGEWSLTLKMWI